MRDTFTELYYHFVWATRGRQPLITPEVEPHLYRFIRHKCEEQRVAVHALDGMDDHVHLACSLPTDLSIATFMHSIKGASAHFVNHTGEIDGELHWQPGYGALTFARRNLPRVVAYIDDQKNHHRDGALSPSMERAAG